MTNKGLADCFLWLAFVLALFFNLWTLTIGFHHNIMDEHSFRQAQTAISTYFLQLGGPFFKYETPLLGAPWSIPFELPLYQWIVAKVTTLGIAPIIESARLVGRFFYLATCIPLFFIASFLGLQRKSILALLIVFLLSPLYLYWSRTFLIETTAVFFGAAFLASVLKILEKDFHPKNHALLIIIGLFFGIMAGTVKATTGFVFFALAAGFYFKNNLLPDQKRSKFIARSVEIIALFLIPTLLTMAWIKYTDLQKQLNPLAEFITSNSLNTWNFGTMADRFSGRFWNMLFRNTIHDSIGHRTVWLFSLVLLFAVQKKFRWLYLVFWCAFLLAPLTFTNLHIQHNYYWVANGIFLIIATGLIIADLIEQTGRVQYLGYLLLVLVCGYEVNHYFKYGYHWQSNDNLFFLDLQAPLASLDTNKDIVLIVGSDWYPAPAFATRKRTLMLRDSVSIASNEFKEALNQLALQGQRIAVLMNCHTGKYAAPFMAQASEIFALDKEPFYKGSCLLYKKKSH